MKTFSQFLYEASATQQRLNDLRDQRDQNRQQNAARYAAKRQEALKRMQQIDPSDEANKATKERDAAAAQKAAILNQIKQHAEAEKQNL